MIDIPKDSKDKIMRTFGHKTEMFFSELDSLILEYKEKWKLNNLIYFDSKTINLIFFCTSELHGDCVLKVCVPNSEIITEINTLKCYGGKVMCNLYEANPERGVFLIERVSPGYTLINISSFIERTELFSNSIKNLHIKYSNTNIFPTYENWLENIYVYMKKIKDKHSKLFNHLDLAMNLYYDLKKQFNRKCLLHGDLHHANMLLNERKSYTIIDPKGVIADPIFETSRFIENEFDFTGLKKEKIIDIIHILSKNLNTREDIIMKCLFIDNAMSCCWHIQDNSPEDFYKTLEDRCDFVYELLKIF